MPSIRVRPTPQGFGRVAPGGGAAIGAALQGVGQVAGEFAELQTNRELLDIRTQVQADALEAQQVEKLERSEAMTQIISKQIARNEASELILSDAGTNKNYDNVQKDMDAFEEDFNQNLFEGRSQQFQDIFLSADQSRRLGNINKTGTAIEAGRLRIMVNNFQASSRDIIDTVTVNTPPSQIREDYEDLRQFAASLGVHQELIEQVVGRDERSAMERRVRSAPLVQGLALLSDQDVASAFTRKQLQTLRSDLNFRKNAFVTNRRFVNEAFTRTTNINALDAFNLGASQTDINRMIESADEISPTAKKDMLDFTESLFLAKRAGPQEIEPEDIKANEAFMENRMDRHIENYNSLLEREGLSGDQERAGILEINDLAISVLAEATKLNVEGKLSSDSLIDLTFDMAPINEGLFVLESQERQGFISEVMEGLRHIRENGFGPRQERIPSAIISDELRKMTEGSGRYGGLSVEHRAVMRALVINETVRAEGFKSPIPIEEAQEFADGILTRAGDRFVSSEFGLIGESSEQVKGLIFNSGSPATEPRQQPLISGIADSIRQSLDLGRSVEEIEEFMRGQPGFTQEAFDRALATLDRFISEAPALPER